MLKKPNGFTKILKVSLNLNDNNFFETMGFLRFKVISDYNHLAVLEVKWDSNIENIRHQNIERTLRPYQDTSHQYANLEHGLGSP